MAAEGVRGVLGPYFHQLVVGENTHTDTTSAEYMCPLSCTFSPVPLNESRSWFRGKNNFSYNILTADSVMPLLLSFLNKILGIF